MPRDLFGDVTRPSISIGNRKWYTVPVSLLSHSAVVLAVIVIPLLATDVLPPPWQKIDSVIIPVAPTPPQPPPTRPKEIIRPLANLNAAPTDAPHGIAPEKPIEPGWENREAPIGVVIGDPDPGVLVAPPPPPPPPPKPIRVGSQVRAPQKIRDVLPEYPRAALLSRSEGVVIIEATIGTDGRVVNAKVLRSVMPLLDHAAIEAVRQWEFVPSLLNGVPVPVIMSVTVNFQLK
jgi:protein TonB